MRYSVSLHMRGIFTCWIGFLAAYPSILISSVGITVIIAGVMTLTGFGPDAFQILYNTLILQVSLSYMLLPVIFFMAFSILVNYRATPEEAYKLGVKLLRASYRFAIPIWFWQQFREFPRLKHF